MFITLPYENKKIKHSYPCFPDLPVSGHDDVRLHIESKKGKAVYRVRIGPLPSDYVAKKVLAQLKQKNHHNIKIIKI